MITVVDGEKKPFFLFVDGLQENETPKSKVRVKNLTEGNHHIKIIFEEQQINNPQTRVELPFGQELLFEIKLYQAGDRKWYAIAKTDQRDIHINPKKNNIDSLSTEELEEAKLKADSIYEAHLPVAEISVPKDTALNLVPDTMKEEFMPDLSEFNCTSPLHPEALNLAILKIKNLSSDEARLVVLKDFVAKNCVSSIQLMELLQFLDFEVSKLELASYAFPFCFDPKNYAFVEDVFEFETTVAKLHDAIYGVGKTTK
ncbi:MAG: DUF4476 domain-containing protein [Flavobacteriales bacterium]|nr:DUF4476 domain-containing protein [Flavobacteriales bacterium]